MIALAFLNPLLLWAVPLAAVPIVIHLLNRRRFQRVPWAAMEYLLAAMKRNRKRMRMEQWLVLLLRTLAVLFLALLVARPQLEGGGLLGATTHHVVVLDDTASMQQRSGSSDLFDRAQDQVKDLVDRLVETRSGDLLSLIRTSRPLQPDLWAQRVGPELGRRVAPMLKEFSVGDGVMDLGEVLAETRKRAVQTKDAGRTDYYIVGDSRNVDWVTDDDKPRPGVQKVLSAMNALTEHVSTMIVGSRDADNLAIVEVRRVDRLAVSGVPVELAVDLQNTGLDATGATEVAVEVDGKSRVVRPVPQLSPGERISIPIVHTFHEAGYHHIDAQLQPTDKYLIDNNRTLALNVLQKSRVLLVDGEPDEDEDEGETMFLQIALDPGGEQPSGVETQVVTEAELAEVDLSPFDLVYLCNVPAPSPAATARLEEYVAGGGGLVLFLGTQVDSTSYNERLYKGGQGLLPLPLGEIAGDPDRRENIFLVDKSHEICGKIGDVLEVLCNTAVLVKRYLTVEEDPKVGAKVLARIGDPEGPPAIVSRTFGSGGGEVVLFAISADKHWSNLPDTYANLVLAHQVHRFAAKVRSLANSNLLTNAVYVDQLDPGLHKPDVTIRALSGDGEELTYTATVAAASSQGQADGEGDGQGGAPGKPGTEQPQSPPEAAPLELRVPLADFHTMGAFEVAVELHSGLPEPRMFARNVPVRESRLVRMTAKDYSRIYPPELHELVTFSEESAGFGGGSGEGELWRWLAATMLAALLLESLLAWRFGRR